MQCFLFDTITTDSNLNKLDAPPTNTSNTTPNKLCNNKLILQDIIISLISSDNPKERYHILVGAMNTIISTPAAKRAFNIVSRTNVLDENVNSMSDEELVMISEYPHQADLWSVYNSTQTTCSSFKDFILMQL